MSVRLLSYTEITTALRCWASWDFSYGDTLAGASLRRRSTAPILTDGRAWGAAIAEWHLTGDAFRAHGIMQDALLADVADMRDRGIEPDWQAVLDQLANLAAIFDHHISIAERMESYGQLEREILLPIPGRNGGQSSKYRFQCFLDGHAVRHGYPAIIEHKLRESLMDLAVVQKMPQYRWYAWAYARAIGWDGPVGVVVDERLKEAPKPVRLVKANAKDIICPVCGAAPGDVCVDPTGKPLRARAYHDERKERLTVSEAVDQVTTVELYDQACVEYGVPRNMAVRNALAARTWSKLHELLFTPAELEEAGRELISGGKLIQMLDSSALYPIRNGSAMNCRGCRFKDICDDPMNDFAVTALYERRPAKRDRA